MSMDSIGKTPLPGQNPNISESQASKPLATLSTIKLQFEAARLKIIKGQTSTKENVKDISNPQLRLAVMWDKTGNQAEESIKGVFLSAINHLKTAFKKQ